MRLRLLDTHPGPQDGRDSLRPFVIEGRGGGLPSPRRVTATVSQLNAITIRGSAHLMEIAIETAWGWRCSYRSPQSRSPRRLRWPGHGRASMATMSSMSTETSAGGRGRTGKRAESSVDKAWSLARAHRGQGIFSKGKD